MKSLTVEHVIFSLAVIASAMAFLASVTLYCHAKWHVRPNRGTLRCLYGYAMIFFAGTSLLCVDWLMGDRAPIPLRPPLDGNARLGFASLMCVWMLACASAFLVQRMFRVIARPEHTPEGRNLQTARLLSGDGQMAGRRQIVRARSPRLRAAANG